MRLILRSDFDGLVSAALLRKVVQIDDYLFAHPKDVQDGKIPVTSNDILSNLPYVEGCGLWFDHHSSEVERVAPETAYEGDCRVAPSAARVIHDYYQSPAFEQYEELLKACDKSDSAQLTLDEVLQPEGWILLSYMSDARTGLGRYHDYKISNYQLMMKLIDLIDSQSIEQILEDPDVKERITLYTEHEPRFKDLLLEKSTLQDNVVVTDVRGIEELPIGNRFVIHALFPETNIAVRVIDGKGKENVVITLGHSIFKKDCKTDVGALMLQYGGGGHRPAGTCQVAIDDADRIIKEIVDKLVDNG
jgi:nanoRNase/pAp phosphatase (c-di-AMP/oligoRNAs hydrolase)